MTLLIILSILAFLFLWRACALGGRADEISEKLYRKHRDKPTSIVKDGHGYASGWECHKCGLIRPWNRKECICDEDND